MKPGQAVKPGQDSLLAHQREQEVKPGQRDWLFAHLQVFEQLVGVQCFQECPDIHKIF